MLKVGLSGGIGSGKSTVSGLLADAGAVVIDYDQLARKVVEPGTVALAAIVDKFGETILLEDGSLNRPALGEIVFADRAARRQLEAITHSAILEAAADIEGAVAADAVVVHDNPLLVEMGGDHFMDVVVIVDVPTQLQVDRIVANRDLSATDARARIAAQASREERIAAADVVIDNSGDRDGLAAQVTELWSNLRAKAASDRL